MADDDVLSDDETASFLSGTRSIPGVSFPLASGLNARQVASAIVGSVAFALGVGVNTIISALAAAYTGVIDGFAGFLSGSDGLVDTIFETGLTAIRGAWSFSLDEFGLFAFPVALTVLLASLWVVQLGVDQIREVA